MGLKGGHSRGSSQRAVNRWGRLHEQLQENSQERNSTHRWGNSLQLCEEQILVSSEPGAIGFALRVCTTASRRVLGSDETLVLADKAPERAM